MIETDDKTEKTAETVKADEEENNPTPMLPPSAISMPAKIADQIGINLRQIGDVQIYDGTTENTDYNQAEQVAIIPESQRAGETTDENHDEPERPASDEPAPEKEGETANTPGENIDETQEDDCEDRADAKENEQRPTTPPISYRPLTTDRPPNISDVHDAWDFFKKMREGKK